MTKYFSMTGLALLTGFAFAGSCFAQEGSSDIFDDLDKNSDGIIAADEVNEEQERFFERMLRVGDANEDGKLSKGEYESTLAEADKPVTPGGNSDRGRGRGNRPDPKEMFKRLDQNNDGKLTRDELPEPLEERMGALFDRAGKDELTQEDMAKMFAQGRGGRPGDGNRNMTDFLKRMDKNNDGKLSRDELPEQARERMSGLFDRLGKDEISFEEIEKYRQQREGEGRPKDGERPKEGDRPRDGERVRNGDRPQDGMRRPPMGERRPPAFVAELDSNRDGQLDKEELSKAGELLSKLDKDGNGKLSPPEMMGFPQRDGDRPPGDRPPGERREGERKDGERPEMKRDAERDGKRPPQGRPNFGPEQLLERMDEDKDGFISKDEAPGRMAENFDKIDTDSDGKLSKDELQKMMEQFRGRRPE